MNMTTIGTLSLRYAKALYGYAADNGEEVKVYDEMKYLSYELISVPDLRKTLLNPILPFETKANIFATSVGGSISECAKHFFSFLYKREKADLLLYIATAYLSVYRKAKGITYVTLITAIEPHGHSVTDKIKDYIAKECNNNNIEMDIEVDPGIIGGFVINVDGKQLNLSVKGELDKIRKSFLKNI